MENLEKEFEELYMKWYSSYMFSAFGGANPTSKEYYDNLKEWCKNHKEESIQYIKAMLEEAPNDIVMILQDLYGKDHFEVDGFMALDQYCNVWLNILNCTIKNGKLKDYYKDYRKWTKYLDKHYMSWRPNLENDPNVTQQQYKEGQRNNENRRQWHDFSLSILKDGELEKLYNEGHLGDMTKYIQELKFFYNRVEEEIKRRNLKKKFICSKIE